MICPACDGEGGRVTWLKDDEEFVWCRTCNGHGWLSEGAPSRSSDATPTASGDSPLAEPFDQKWERMYRASEEDLSRLEQTP